MLCIPFYIMIDTHAHLDLISNDPEEQDAVIARAHEAGVHTIIQVSVDTASNLKSGEIAQRHHSVFYTVGLHPHEADRVSREDIQRIENQLDSPNVVAIGEIGLDYYRHYSDYENQRKLFDAQLIIAHECQLPVVIHNRESIDDVYARLCALLPPGGIVVHCNSVDAEWTRKLLDIGAYISFAGNITYNRSLTDSANSVPLDRLLVETDSPYLTPVPHRGKPNEPAYVMHTAQFLADQRSITRDELERATDANARRIFGLI